MTAERQYKHFIITRFNIRIHHDGTSQTHANEEYYDCLLKNPTRNPRQRILDADYLAERFAIFEKYTLPSIKQQSNQNFTWLILFHRDTPERFKKQITALKRKFPFVDLYFGDEESFDFAAYCDQQAPNTPYFTTTRIDNDDMFSPEYVARVQAYADANLHECVLSFSQGRKLDLQTRKQYACHRDDNHFLSMIAPKTKNILQYNHAKIFSYGHEVVILDSTAPMWTEISHASNVTNHIDSTDQELNN